MSTLREKDLEQTPEFYKDPTNKPKRSRFSGNISFDLNLPSVVEYVDGLITQGSSVITFKFKNTYKFPPIYRGLYVTKTGKEGILYANRENFLFSGDPNQVNHVNIDVYPEIPQSARIRIYNISIQE